jgi:RNA polymerase sigma factor (sigma-70 family)
VSDADSDLLAYMAMADADPAGARSAGGEFYARHRKWLYWVLSRTPLGRAFEASGMLGDMVQEAFLRAYHRAATYQAPEEGGADAHRHSARAWLAGIAKNVMNDTVAGAEEEAAGLRVVGEWTEVENEVSAVEPGPESDALALTRAALEQLSERERDILYTTMQFEKPGQRHQRLPKAIMAELAARTGTTPENIRTIRKRAREKVEEYVTARRADLGSRSARA